MKEFFACSIKILVSGILLLLTFSAYAQERQYRDAANPDKGYWQIVTNPGDNSTVIRFFNGQNQQVYEETIAGKYIRLTPRNINRINKTFDQVVGKTMVMAQVKSAPLTSSAFRKLTSRHSQEKREEAENAAASSLSPAGLQVHAFQLLPTDKLELNILNPTRKRLLINLYDKVGDNIYHESSAKPKYKRSFSFKGTYGQYKIVVTTTDKKFKYSKKIDLTTRQEMPPAQQPLAQEPLNENLANR